MAQNPVVTITMENGDVIKAELYPEKAPNTVNNFISLVKKGYYDGLIFHRVIAGFMIQGGCPDGTGMGGPGYSRCSFHGTGYASGFRRFSVLYYASGSSPSGWRLCCFRKGNRRHGCCKQDRTDSY